MSKWKNLGDEDYLNYGGCLVRKSKEGIQTYDVFFLDTNLEFCDYFAGLGTVDLYDNNINYNEVLDYLGWIEYKDMPIDELLDKMSPELLCRGIVEHYGIQNFNPIVVKNEFINPFPEFDDFRMNLEELEYFFECFGIDKDIELEDLEK